MRTLLVAPRHSDLPSAMVDSEVGDVLNSGLLVSPVLGAVTADRFLQTVSGGSHDMLFLVTHGTPAGIVLSDGVLPTSMFVQAVRDRFDLVVLNTCSGLNVAQMIQNECGSGVICTIGEVEERAAYFTGAQLARELAKGLSYYDAYKRARPGSNTTYVFLAGKAMSNTNLRALVREIVEEETMQIISRLDALQSEISQDREERRERRERGVSITDKQINRLLWALIGIAIIIAFGFYLLANVGAA